jgi:hypothetical protein
VVAVPIRPRWGAGALVGVLAVALLVGALPTVGPGHPAALPNGPIVSVRPAAACSGTARAASVAGSLSVEGTRTPRPTVANATVSVRYLYQTNQTSKLGTTLTCSVADAVVPTNASGGFSANLSIPSTSCGMTGCLTYLGPFGPLGFRVTTGQTPGYFLSTHWVGTTVDLAWVDALASAATNPSEFATVSVGAPTTVSAVASDGAGAPSTANVSYGWVVNGVGWTETGPTNGSALSVRAAPSAGPGTATLWVNGSYNGTAIDLPPVNLYLTATATTVTAASFTPNLLDIGTTASVTLTGTGADGYAYTATLAPELGLPVETSRCAVTPTAGGDASLSCAFLVTYNVSGSAQPTANLSNGFSTSQTWEYPNVVVSNALAVVVTPDPAEAYANGSVRLAVGVVGDTGTAPYGPACLLTGDGRFYCDESPGSNWTLSASYPTVGTYSAVVTVADASGANRTTSVPVNVVARPSAPVVELASSSIPRNGSVSATALYTGGAFPLAYWWNTTGPDTVYSGAATTDAIPGVTFQVNTVGSEVVTLTVVDALGTVETGSAKLQVVGGPPRSLVASAPLANGTVEAGTPVPIRLGTVDGYGDPAPSAPGPVSVEVPSSCGEAWVNTSLGPAEANASGSYLLPAAAWSSGSLNLTFAATRAGACVVDFAGPSTLSGGASVTVDVSVNPYHVLLTDPRTVATGPGTSATLYAIADVFGNPQTSGFVEVRSVFPGGVSDLDSPIRAGPDGGAVWVNFTSNGPDGTGYVISEYNEKLLGPLVLPAPPSTNSLSTTAAVGGVAAVLVGALVVAAVVVRRRRSAALSAPREEPTDPDEPLRRLAEGRAHVLSRLSYDRDSDLDAVAAGFPGPSPDAAELAEWVGTLVTEGLVRPMVGPDGRPRFRLANPEPRPTGPRVEVDPMALDAALARRDLDAEEPDGPST